MRKTTRSIARFLLVTGMSWAINLSAEVIDFTTAEGYTTATLAENSAWGGSGSYALDGSGTGTVTLDSATSYQRVYLLESLGSNEVYSVGIKFSFDRVADAGYGALMALSFGDAVSTSAKRISVQLERQNWNKAKYLLRFYDNSGSTSSDVTSSGFDETDMGFGISDGSSDELWLGLSVVRNEDASSWEAALVMSNLTTSAELVSLNIDSFDTAPSFWEGSVYPFINSVGAESATQTSNRVIDWIEFSAGTAPGAPTTSYISNIDFTDVEGYQDGQLNANGSWSGHSNFSVDSTAGTVTPDVTGWKIAVHSQNQGGADEYAVGLKFSFNRVEGATISGVQEVIGVGFGDEYSVSSSAIMLRIQRAAWDSSRYILRYYENSGSASSYDSASSVSEELLGFGEGDAQSDDLWLSLTLVPGGDASSWTVSGELKNLTEGTVISVLDPVTVELSSAFFEGNLYGLFNSMGADSSVQVSNRVIDSFYLAAKRAPSSFSDWVIYYELSGDDALASADPDGDGYCNIQEYGLGGDPKSAEDSLYVPHCAVNGDRFELVHVVLTNTISGIDYIVETTTNLLSGAWTDTGISTVRGAFADDMSFDSVTNRIPMNGMSSAFIRLRIEEQE